jgi:hypothetical protein
VPAAESLIFGLFSEEGKLCAWDGMGWDGMGAWKREQRANRTAVSTRRRLDRTGQIACYNNR